MLATKILLCRLQAHNRSTLICTASQSESVADTPCLSGVGVVLCKPDSSTAVASWETCLRSSSLRRSCFLIFISLCNCACPRASSRSQSIRNHDQGKKHVEIVAEFFRKKREDKLKGAQSESDLKRQMDKIEKVTARTLQWFTRMQGWRAGEYTGLARRFLCVSGVFGIPFHVFSLEHTPITVHETWASLLCPSVRRSGMHSASPTQLHACFPTVHT